LPMPRRQETRAVADLARSAASHAMLQVDEETMDETRRSVTGAVLTVDASMIDSSP
jgi:hypothetical protein